MYLLKKNEKKKKTTEPQYISAERRLYATYCLHTLFLCGLARTILSTEEFIPGRVWGTSVSRGLMTTREEKETGNEVVCERVELEIGHFWLNCSVWFVSLEF